MTNFNSTLLLQRVSYGALAIAFLCALFGGDAAIAWRAEALDGPLGDLLRRGSIVPVTTAVVFLLAAVELTHLLRLTGARPYATLAYPLVVGLILVPWLSAAGWLGQSAAHLEGFPPLLVGMMLAVLGTIAAAVLRGRTAGVARDVGGTWLIITYLGFLGSLGVQLRCGRDVPEQAGAWLVLILVLVTKASDIGAFFVGSAIGRHKLLPSVSPAKSVEGTIGGLLASIGVAVAIVLCGPKLMAGYRELYLGSNQLGLKAALLALSSPDGIPPWLRATVLGACLSAVGQIGDLFESCFKREAGVKDSSNLIPYFGGILDLVDSLIPAIPVGWFLLTVVWEIV